jgi:hypothetical protein
MPDRSLVPTPTSPAWHAGWLPLCLALAGCAPLKPPVQAPAPVVVPPPAPAPQPAPPPPAPAPAPAVPEPADAAARRLLLYNEQLRQLPAAELANEINRLNGALGTASPVQAPAVTVELALALAQTRNPADTVRALALLDPIARTPSADQQPWQALARLLVARIGEQRRLEEQLERQAGALRESQRNVQQLNEKLEALKAIERSLNNRPPTAPTPPAASAAPAPRP